MYAGKGDQEGVCPGVRYSEVNTLPQQGAVEPNVIVYARRNLRRPPATTLGLAQRRTRGHAKTSRTNASNRPGPGGEKTALLKSSGQSCIGQAKTTSVIDTITRQAAKSMLAGTYP
jgi:hypothetical protein